MTKEQPTPIRHRGTKHVVCPHCGYSYWECDFLEDEHSNRGVSWCDGCGEKFEWEAKFKVTLYANKVTFYTKKVKAA